MGKNLESCFKKVSIVRDPPANLEVADESLFRDYLNYNTLGDAIKFFGRSYVTSDSVVYDRFWLQAATLADAAHKAYYQFRHLAKNWLKAKRRVLNDKRTYLLATDYY